MRGEQVGSSASSRAGRCGICRICPSTWKEERSAHAVSAGQSIAYLARDRPVEECSIHASPETDLLSPRRKLHLGATEHALPVACDVLNQWETTRLTPRETLTKTARESLLAAGTCAASCRLHHAGRGYRTGSALPRREFPCRDEESCASFAQGKSPRTHAC